MALVVLDASLVIAFRRTADALHARAAAAFRSHRTDEFVLPASAYSETLVSPMRVGVHEVALLDEFIAEFPIRIVPITPEIARRAASLRAGSTWLRLPDALVLATADVLEAPGVLTGDARWQGLSARVQVI